MCKDVYRGAEMETKPFYYTSGAPLVDDTAVLVEHKGSTFFAPSGWYQHTPEGLKYLGESILEREPNS
jgi:hypothetical protein